jgi:hypothetical protein
MVCPVFVAGVRRYEHVAKIEAYEARMDAKRAAEEARKR